MSHTNDFIHMLNILPTILLSFEIMFTFKSLIKVYFKTTEQLQFILQRFLFKFISKKVLLTKTLKNVMSF